MKFIAETEQKKSHREIKLLDMLIESRKGIWDEKYSYVQINESEHGVTSCWRFDSPSFVPQIFSREAFLERAKQLAAMGDELRLTEEQAKALAERMPQTGTLQTLDDQPLSMAKRIEELEAQVRDLATPEGWKLVPLEPTRAMREAFHEAHEEWGSGDNWRLDSPDHQWRAMLAASPSPGSAK